MVRLATTTTLRDAGDVVDTFVRYQHAIGFEHVFLFFDDPYDSAYDRLANVPGVTCFRAGPELLAEQRNAAGWDIYGAHHDVVLMARQHLNTSIAIAIARARWGSTGCSTSTSTSYSASRATMPAHGSSSSMRRGTIRPSS